MHLYAALITVLTSVLMLVTGVMVARARGIYQITAPATTGHPTFDRIFRVQMNTLEQVAIFLPVLWLASIYSNERIAAYAGGAWLLGRVWYISGYIQEADKRSGGFLVSIVAFFVLLAMSLWGIIGPLLAQD